MLYFNTRTLTCGLLRVACPDSAAGVLGFGVLGGRGGGEGEVIRGPVIFFTMCLNSLNSAGSNVTLSLCVSKILDRRECGTGPGMGEVCPRAGDACPGAGSVLLGQYL